MSFRSKWNYLEKHGIWSKVIANAIWWGVAFIAGLIFTLCYSLFKSIDFASALKTVLDYEITVRTILVIAVCISVLIIIAKWVKYKLAGSFKKIETELESVSALIDAQTAKKDNLPVKNIDILPTDHRFPFNSNNAQFSAFQAYGEKGWDTETKKSIGPNAIGDFSFINNVLSIDRKDIAGKFIVKFAGYYYDALERNFIPKNLEGKNPRFFKLTFAARSLKGQQKLIFTFQKLGTHDWLSHPEYIIANKEWQNQSASISVFCHQDIFIQLQITEIGVEPGLIQIKNILVEETEK